MKEAASQTKTPELNEAQVAEYLAAHPDFLLRHPDTFERVDVPHETGGAISLVERQVRILRDTNAEIQARFEALFATAKSNEDRVIQLNRVARIMAAAVSIDAMLGELAECAHHHLAVERVYIGMHGPLPAEGTRVRALDEDPEACRALTNAFRRGKPICGQLSASHSAALFPPDDKDKPMASAAVIPFQVEGSQGAVVLASHDAGQFSADMGTLFLELFGSLLEVTLARLLGKQSGD